MVRYDGCRLLRFVPSVDAAQLFPLRMMFALAVDNIYGEYRTGDTDIYVSSGFSDWAFPLRSEANCSYEVIHLSPAE